MCWLMLEVVSVCFHTQTHTHHFSVLTQTHLAPIEDDCNVQKQIRKNCYTNRVLHTEIEI